jgi:molybdate transport system substrate-binding protein
VTGDLDEVGYSGDSSFTTFGATHISQSNAADIRLGTTRAVVTILNQIGPQFEKATGHTLKVSSDLGPNIVKRITAGEKFDLIIIGPTQIDDLIKAGRLLPATRTGIVRSGIGVEVRVGAPKPDISSVDAFKKALLNAKSIAYLKEGASGVYIAGMLERLGIADAIKAKVTRPDTDIVSELVAKGEIELGMVVSTQILTTKGVVLVGPLPPELQSYITFFGAISSDSPAPDAAKSLIDFLKGPIALPVMKSQGMEPG